ncbi:helix-turn-helix domain-containing protein [Paenibacillus sp. FSL K6-1230]|uniref:helix-turn-helix domain-containing protein n=1 Tax=Paenibacillus sp. FSL K6-1230 TaxID=2921603 RepID=UPI0030F99110
MSIVENIRVLCKEANTSIPKLEKGLGFGNGAIYNWDKNSPSIDKMQKVADYFNVSIERVLYGFELSRFEGFVRIIVGSKEVEEVAKASGVDADILDGFLIGACTNQPNFEFVDRLAMYNPYEAIVTRSDLIEAAGYETDKKNSNTKLSPSIQGIQTVAAHHEGEEWNEDELAEIERFKEFVRSKRKGN